jgi:hypothetical protein
MDLCLQRTDIKKRQNYILLTSFLSSTPSSHSSLSNYCPPSTSFSAIAFSSLHQYNSRFSFLPLPVASARAFVWAVFSVILWMCSYRIVFLYRVFKMCLYSRYVVEVYNMQRFAACVFFDLVGSTDLWHKVKCNMVLCLKEKKFLSK